MADSPSTLPPLRTGRIPLIHHPDYVAPTPPGSRYRFDKYGLIMQALDDLGAPLSVHRPDPMPRPWIEAIHDPAYVDEVLAAAVPREKEKRIGFAVTKRIARRSLLSVGGTWLAAKLALAQGYAANAAGGSHHALADTGAGYCVFNDLAIAADRLVAEGTVARILILDLDVHQGDGTASLLAGRPEMFTLSIHAARNFPAVKARSTLDISLPDGTGDEDYLVALEDALAAGLAFGPDLILYQAGVDVHGADRLGRLALTDAGLAARDALVARRAADAAVPLASVLGGGYGEDRMAVARRHARTIMTLAETSGAAALARDAISC